MRIAVPSNQLSRLHRERTFALTRAGCLAAEPPFTHPRVGQRLSTPLRPAGTLLWAWRPSIDFCKTERNSSTDREHADTPRPAGEVTTLPNLGPSAAPFCLDFARFSGEARASEPSAGNTSEEESPGLDRADSSEGSRGLSTSESPPRLGPHTSLSCSRCVEGRSLLALRVHRMVCELRERNAPTIAKASGPASPREGRCIRTETEVRSTVLRDGRSEDLSCSPPTGSSSTRHRALRRTPTLCS
jgi:hypothetical protein